MTPSEKAIMNRRVRQARAPIAIATEPTMTIVPSEDGTTAWIIESNAKPTRRVV